MEYVNLGRTGLKVSRLCLGMMSYGTPRWREWVLDEDAGRPIIRRALELGINFFDTADMYSGGVSEEVTGRAIRDFARREDVVVATKVFFPTGDGPNARGLSRKHICDAIDASLRRLGMDYVDLYQIHRYDPATPIDETLEALSDLVRAGKVRYLGASSMYAWQFAQALSLAERRGWARFVSMQNHYNLVYREEEREMLPLCRHEGIGVIPWSPLARGFLAGNRRAAGTGGVSDGGGAPGEGDVAADSDVTTDDAPTPRARTDDFAHSMYCQPADFAVVDQVVAVAQARGVQPAQIALAWLLHKPGVTAPIVGATRMAHLEAAVGAVDIRLSDEEIAALEAPYVPHAVLGHS